jgi:hypothetical protein
MTGMDDLSPKARALVQTSRKGLRASAADRERIEAALRARLGTDALPLEANVARTSSLGGTAALAGAAIGVCVLGAVALLSLRPATAPELRPQPPTILTPAAPPSAANPGSLDLEPPSPTASEPHTTQTPRPRATLGREVALLSRATRALRTGKPAAALKVLDQHQRQFPNGALGEERRAARAEALCALGRMQQGTDELAQLSPQTPTAARARQACDDALSK